MDFLLPVWRTAGTREAWPRVPAGWNACNDRTTARDLNRSAPIATGPSPFQPRNFREYQKPKMPKKHSRSRLCENSLTFSLSNLHKLE